MSAASSGDRRRQKRQARIAELRRSLEVLGAKIARTGRRGKSRRAYELYLDCLVQQLELDLLEAAERRAQG